MHNGQATSVRCGAAPRRFYHYLISTEYRYDIKDPSAPLGMTIREAGYLTWLFIRSRRRLPLRGSLSSAFSAPLLQGAAPLACKSATPKRHSLPDGKVNEMRVPPSPYQKPSPRGEGAPKGRIGYWRYESEREKRLKQAKMRIPLSPYRHFERSEKSSLHTGQATSVR